MVVSKDETKNHQAKEDEKGGECTTHGREVKIK
jgi:hypothetical protein